MAETVKEAQHALRHARREQQEKAAAFWRNTVDQGRILRQAAAQIREEKPEQKPQRQRQ
jgi:hypothetical protein